MNKTILISEMLKFHFGSKIFCSDGDGGILEQVIFDPATLSMTHIGVKHGRLFGKNVFLPFDCVISANEAGITQCKAIRCGRCEKSRACGSSPNQ